MGSSREGFNLFRKLGRKHFFSKGIFGSEGARQYVLKDAFGRFVCKIIGHSKTFETDDIPSRKVCSRCYKYEKNLLK